ncbi:MAG: glycosyltransferase family 9 protein [Candidatus Omnitrophota bacterium]|jgi:heptosyltransferase-2
MREYIKALLSVLFLLRLARKARQLYYRIFDLIVGKLIFPVFLFIKRRPLPAPGGKINKILVIRLDRIGDIVLSTPAIRSLRRSFPEATIHFMATKYTKDILLGNPNIDQVRVYEEGPCKEVYDAAVALHPGILQNYLVFASGAHTRIGYGGFGGSFFLTHIIPDPRREPICHEVEVALKAVKELGCSPDDQHLEIFKNADSEGFVQQYLEGLGISESDFITVIHPGSRQEYLRWGKDKFAHIALRLMRERKAKVIITGSSKEDKLVKEVASLMEDKPFCCTGLTLGQLISLLGKAKLFVGNSTGPMHIAAALNIPVVAIFGPQHQSDSYLRWGPWSKNSVVVRKEQNCRDCLPSQCFSIKCIKSISEGEVWEGIEKVLNE